ncbi:MAG: right-handed parallel beta-helix repeat-containing protein, partial [Thermoplasmatota archaeon]
MDNEVDARLNWWGDATGPSGMGNGSGDTASDYVEYRCWLDAPYPDGVARCYNTFIDDNKNGVYDNGELIWDTIQDAINNATDGDQIVVKSGTFRENVEVNVSNITIINGSTPIVDGEGGIGFDVNVSGVTIDGFIIYNCSDGIFLDGDMTDMVNRTTISNNIIYNCTNDGIEMDYCNDTLVDNSTIYNITGYEGIDMDDCYNTTISYTTIHDCVQEAIELRDCYDTVISHCTLYTCDLEGIDMQDCVNTNISWTEIYDITNDGVEMEHCNYTDIFHLTVYNIHDNYEGVDVESNSNNTNIFYATIYNVSDNGLEVDDSNYTTLSYNTVYDIGDDGINIDNSGHTTLYDNMVDGCGEKGAHLIDCDDNTIDSNIFRNNSAGIYLENATATIIGNRIAENPFNTGIWADHASDGLTITNNNIVGNDVGIRLDNHTATQIHYNNIWNNTIAGLNNTNMTGFTPLSFNVNATHNWWGWFDGPGNRTGLVLDALTGAPADGSGDNVTNNTHFAPFNPGLGNDTQDPFAQMELGNPKVLRDDCQGTMRYAIKSGTPLWVNATDFNGTGVDRMWVDIYIDPTPCDPTTTYQFKERRWVYDNGANDGDPRIGEISFELHMEESCLHELVFHVWDLAENEYEDDYIFIVDACLPTASKFVGEPKISRGSDPDRWVNYETPFYITANDSCCLPNGTGVERLRYSLHRYNESKTPFGWEEQVNVTIWDQSDADQDDRLGFIRTPDFNFSRDCRHEIRWKVWDYVGNSAGGKQEHWVDGTPPNVTKVVEPNIIVDGKNFSIATSVINFTAVDEGCRDGVGLNTTYGIKYNVTWIQPNGSIVWTGWTNYTGNFTFEELGMGGECTHIIAVKAKDWLGNEYYHEQYHYIDNTPPDIIKRHWGCHGEQSLQELYTQLSESFEGDPGKGIIFPPSGWTIHDLGSVQDGSSETWRQNIYDSYDGDWSAECEAGEITEYQNEWLVTPKLDLGEDPELTFWTKFDVPAEDTDSNYLWLSTTGNAVGDFTVQLREWNNSKSPLPEEWTKVTVDLSAWENTTVWLAWQYQSIYGERWFIDLVESTGLVSNGTYMQPWDNISLDIFDFPEGDCGSGVNNTEMYFRYVYDGVSHPVDMDDPLNHYYGDPVRGKGGRWWWNTTESSWNLTFYEGCRHDLYYYFNASDMLNNTVNSSIYHQVYYLDDVD